MKKKYETPSSEVFTLSTRCNMLVTSSENTDGTGNMPSGGSFGSRREYFNEDED